MDAAPHMIFAKAQDRFNMNIFDRNLHFIYIYTGEVRQIHSMYCVLIENSLRRPTTTIITSAAV